MKIYSKGKNKYKELKDITKKDILEEIKDSIFKCIWCDTKFGVENIDDFKIDSLSFYFVKCPVCGRTKYCDIPLIKI